MVLGTEGPGMWVAVGYVVVGVCALAIVATLLMWAAGRWLDSLPIPDDEPFRREES